MPLHEQRYPLVADGRAEAAPSFMTSPGGTADGTAVLAAAGRVCRSGECSSSIHVTAVHGEQSAHVPAARRTTLTNWYCPWSPHWPPRSFGPVASAGKYGRSMGPASVVFSSSSWPADSATGHDVAQVSEVLLLDSSPA